MSGPNLAETAHANVVRQEFKQEEYQVQYSPHIYNMKQEWRGGEICTSLASTINGWHIVLTAL